jgi:hypothetical protein
MRIRNSSWDVEHVLETLLCVDVRGGGEGRAVTKPAHLQIMKLIY